MRNAGVAVALFYRHGIVLGCVNTSYRVEGQAVGSRR